MLPTGQALGPQVVTIPTSLVGGSAPRILSPGPPPGPQVFHTAAPTMRSASYTAPHPAAYAAPHHPTYAVPSQGAAAAAYRSYRPAMDGPFNHHVAAAYGSMQMPMGHPVSVRQPSMMPMVHPVFGPGQFGPQEFGPPDGDYHHDHYHTHAKTMRPFDPFAPPRDVYVDRPYPMFQEVPVPVHVPGFVTETFRQIAPREDHDFPYHDPAYGMGWRYHYPDTFDEQWNQMQMSRETPFSELLHRREEENWRDRWEDAHMGESEHRGWHYRPAPFSRRVRDPEKLIPTKSDFYTELRVF